MLYCAPANIPQSFDWRSQGAVNAQQETIFVAGCSHFAYFRNHCPAHRLRRWRRHSSSSPEAVLSSTPTSALNLSGLAEGYEAGQFTQSQAASETAINSGGSIAVTIYLNANVDAVVRFLEDDGGNAPRNVGEDYIEAYVPVSLLGSLSQQPGVIRVREIIPPEPDRGRGDVTSQGVRRPPRNSLARARRRHYRGQGVKVGALLT